MGNNKIQQEDLREIVESLNDIIYELDDEGCFSYCNQMLPKITGYTKNELKSIHYYDLVVDDKRSELIEFYKQQRKYKVENTYYEFPLIAKSGKQFWIGQNVKMIYDKSGHVVTVRAVARDITSLKSNVEQSEEKSLLLQSILDTMSEAVVVANTNGEFIVFNQAAEKLLGIGATNSSPSEWSKIYGVFKMDKKTMVPEEELPLVRAINGEIVDGYEAYLKNNFTEQGIYALVNARPLKDSAGNLIGGVVVFNDFTERKNSELQMKESEEKFRSMSDTSPFGIFVTDENGHCEYTNKEYQRLSGLTLEQSLGMGWVEAIHPEDRNKVLTSWQKVVEKHEKFNTELRFLRKDGTRVMVEVNATVISVNDEIMGYVGAVEDVTLRKEHEYKLLKAKEMAETASKAKEEFLSTMSHEIRTPLNAVIGMTHLLMQEEPLKRQISNLETLKFSSENLLVIINDILDYNKIESGNVTFEEVEIKIEELVKTIKQSLSFKAEDKGIKFNALFDTDIPKFLIGDPVRLNQILTNLVNNAIKFTENGFVKIDIELISESEKEAELKFIIEDSGIGIAKENLDRIFDRFSQAEKDTTRKYGGTGLGLAITKKLLQLQGSEIFVESEFNQGSKFYFTLKFKKGSQTRTHENPSQTDYFPMNLSGINLLLVEDNLVNQVVATKFLDKWNVKTTIANNGIEALEIVQANEFDVVLMDLEMPKMDGYETTQKIRSFGGSLGELPIIALTASAQVEIKERVLKTGMNDFITKPFDPALLYSKIAKTVNIDVFKMRERVMEQTEGNQLISYRKVENIADGDKEFLVKMFDSYVIELNKAKQNIKEILKEEDMDMLKAQKHKILSSSQLFETFILEKEFQKAENALESGERKNFTTACRNISKLCDTLIDLLKVRIQRDN